MLIPLLSFSSSSTYPEITSDAQRQDYKREFDADLREYKRLCAEMDDINDQLNKLSRQLDTLDDTSAKYQVRYAQCSPQMNLNSRERGMYGLHYKEGMHSTARISSTRSHIQHIWLCLGLLLEHFSPLPPAQFLLAAKRCKFTSYKDSDRKNKDWNPWSSRSWVHKKQT